MAIRTAASFYDTMSTEEICNLPIQQIADNNCILFLWVTSPLLPEGFKVIERWGFKYKTIGFTWIKTYGSGALFNGMGHYTRPSTELCLLATKGSLKRLDRSVYQVYVGLIGKHSTKPPEIRNRIVDLFGDLPRIELFARTKSLDWDVWGNEIDQKHPQEFKGLELFI